MEERKSQQRKQTVRGLLSSGSGVPIVSYSSSSSSSIAAWSGCVRANSPLPPPPEGTARSSYKWVKIRGGSWFPPRREVEEKHGLLPDHIAFWAAPRVARPVGAARRQWSAFICALYAGRDTSSRLRAAIWLPEGFVRSVFSDLGNANTPKQEVGVAKRKVSPCSCPRVLSL